jgi:hypothetical protein
LACPEYWRQYFAASRITLIAAVAAMRCWSAVEPDGQFEPPPEPLLDPLPLPGMHWL